MPRPLSAFFLALCFIFQALPALGDLPLPLPDETEALFERAYDYALFEHILILTGEDKTYAWNGTDPPQPALMPLFQAFC